MITAYLQYFKPNGTFYSSSSIPAHNDRPVGEVVYQVRHLRKLGRLPGLAPTSSGVPHEFIVHVSVPDHPDNFPTLILS